MVRVATAKFQIPRLGATLFRMCRGIERPPVALGMHQQAGRFLTIRGLENMGFGRHYFSNDFILGTTGALQHLANIVIPQAQEQLRKRGNGTATIIHSETGLETSLVSHLAGGLAALEEDGLELAWGIQEVTASTLGNVCVVYGIRRSRGVPTGEWAAAAASYAGHKIVFRGDQRRVLARDGATISADAIVTVRQTVTLKLWACGDVVAADFADAATHVVRMEAELVHADPGLLSLEFDAERGWTVCDINEALGGNCVARKLPEAH